MPKTSTIVPVEATETKPAKEGKQAAPCRCGCGEMANPGRMFRQGHDQRLVGLLATDVVERDGKLVGFDRLPADWSTSDMTDRIERAFRVITDRFSPALAAKFESAATRRAAKVGRANARTQQHATVAQLQAAVSAGQQQATTEPPAGTGSPVRFKVGKRTKVYDGFVHGMNQAGKITAVRYTTGTGNETVTTNFTVVV